MRGTTQKNKKPGQKTTSLGRRGSKMRLRSQDPQKAHLELLLNTHTKFQLLYSIWRVVMRGTNSKNDGVEKTRPKSHFYEAMRD